MPGEGLDLGLYASYQFIAVCLILGGNDWLDRLGIRVLLILNFGLGVPCQ